MMRWLILIVVMLMLIIVAVPVAAQGPTPTPTLTPTATPLSNSDRLALSTIAPPGGCGLANYNPCGPLPFQVPRFSSLNLPSPTAWPTVPSATPIPITATPSYTPTFTPTSTGTITLVPTATHTIGPSPTATATQMGVEAISTLGAGASDMAGTLIAQSTRQLIIEGTPQSGSGIASGLGTYAGALFSVARSFTTNFGKAGPVVLFLLVALAYVLIIYIATFILPIVVFIVRFIMELINTAKPI